MSGAAVDRPPPGGSAGARSGVECRPSPAEILDALRAGTLQGADFHHRDHVGAAWACLQAEPFAEAAPRFAKDIRGFARANGAEHRYHETITWAYLVLIHERLERGGRGLPWEEFAGANQDLLDGRSPIVRRFYRPETIESDLARRVFLMPDAFLGSGGP